MNPVRIHSLPQSIEQKLSEAVTTGIKLNGIRHLGEMYLMQGWEGSSYSNDVFFNSYLFGAPVDGVVPIAERRLRMPIRPKDKLINEAAISLIFDEQDTINWMENGPGRYATAASIPLIRSFFQGIGEGPAPL